MFRGFLSLSTGVLVLLCITAIPGQVQAQRIRSGFRPGVPVPFNRRFIDPRFGRFNPVFDRRFFDPRFAPLNPAFDPRFIDPRFSRFNPVFDRRLFDARFLGF